MSEPPADEPPGSLQPISAAALSLLGVLGLAAGYLARPLMVRWTGTAPLVTWTQALALFFVSAVLAYVAWLTRQAVRQRPSRFDAQRFVNRLVLARSCALVGALVAGAYAGYGITWLGDGSEIAGQRLLRCAVAAVAGVLVMVTSLALERACRVPKDSPES